MTTGAVVNGPASKPLQTPEWQSMDPRRFVLRQICTAILELFELIADRHAVPVAICVESATGRTLRSATSEAMLSKAAPGWLSRGRQCARARRSDVRGAVTRGTGVRAPDSSATL
jgi:hypothetical protein